MAALSEAKYLLHSAVSHKLFKSIMEFVLTVAIFYFVIAGALVVAFRTDSYWLAVISGSMSHEDNSWENYYFDLSLREEVLQKFNIPIPPDAITTVDTSNFPIRGGFERGDMLIIQGVSSPSDISIGDVLIINRSPNIPLTHRVFAKWEENGLVRFTTKGDHNSSFNDPTQKELITSDYAILPEKVVGKVVFVIPKIGNIALWLQGR